MQVTGFQRLSNMCEVDIDIFCDGDRQHMKEGIVLVVRAQKIPYFILYDDAVTRDFTLLFSFFCNQDEDNGSQINLRIQRVAVQLLYGRQVFSFISNCTVLVALFPLYMIM